SSVTLCPGCKPLFSSASASLTRSSPLNSMRSSFRVCDGACVCCASVRVAQSETAKSAAVKSVSTAARDRRMRRGTKRGTGFLRSVMSWSGRRNILSVRGRTRPPAARQKVIKREAVVSSRQKEDEQEECEARDDVRVKLVERLFQKVSEG